MKKSFLKAISSGLAAITAASALSTASFAAESTYKKVTDVKYALAATFNGGLFLAEKPNIEDNSEFIVIDSKGNKHVVENTGFDNAYAIGAYNTVQDIEDGACCGDNVPYILFENGDGYSALLSDGTFLDNGRTFDEITNLACESLAYDPRFFTNEGFAADYDDKTIYYDKEGNKLFTLEQSDYGRVYDYSIKDKAYLYIESESITEDEEYIYYDYVFTLVKNGKKVFSSDKHCRLVQNTKGKYYLRESYWKDDEEIVKYYSLSGKKISKITEKKAETNYYEEDCGVFEVDYNDGPVIKNTKTNKVISSFSWDDGTFTFSGKYLYIVTKKNGLKIYNIKSGKLVGKNASAKGSYITASENGKYLVTGNKIYNYKGKKISNLESGDWMEVYAKNNILIVTKSQLVNEKSVLRISTVDFNTGKVLNKGYMSWKVIGGFAYSNNLIITTNKNGTKFGAAVIL